MNQRVKRPEASPGADQGRLPKRRKICVNYSAFADAIRAAGYEPPTYIESGCYVRFPAPGKPPSNRAAWAIQSDDRRAGCFGDWISGAKHLWFADARPSRVYRKRWAKLAHEAEAKRKADQEQAADRAHRSWAESRPASPDHPYLERKRIQAHCARQRGDVLVLPVQDFQGELWSLQFITPNGAKSLMKRGRYQGRFTSVSGVPGSCVLIAEGFSTAATVAEAMPEAWTISAISAGNLASIAEGARAHLPDAVITVCADNDKTGLKAGREAAYKARARLAVPPVDGDFNDWLCQGGAG